ncbi:MAG TPA: hypothetical protein VJ732_13465 [Bryobacteraceae bacterium]|nr:hypothetical protein [Bryobacteraceae bacterium]
MWLLAACGIAGAVFLTVACSLAAERTAARKRERLRGRLSTALALAGAPLPPEPQPSVLLEPAAPPRR